MTKQKLIISQIVENSCGHPTAEEIYLEAKSFCRQLRSAPFTEI